MDSSEGKHDELELLMDTSKEKQEPNDKKAQFSWTSFLQTLFGLILTILSVGVACISYFSSGCWKEEFRILSSTCSDVQRLWFIHWLD